MQIVTRQISGLGNQLFQYAAGRYYAREHNADLRISVDAAEGAVSHGYPRPFLLSHFKVRAPWSAASWRDRFLLSKRRSIQTVSVPLKRAFGVAEFTEPFEQRYSFLERLPVEQSIRTLYLGGYWQTYRMVSAVADSLREEFQFKQQAQGKTAEVLKQIGQCVHPVSLHMRRGDYTLAAEGRIALSGEYYSEAIEMMQKNLQDPIFFIFSDDIPFAKANLPDHIKKVFVNHNDDYSSHEDLRLMSHCHHHIIANSTFSWWGAWMNSRPGKIVIAPKHWLLTKKSYYPDLFAPDWILLETAVE